MPSASTTSIQSVLAEMKISAGAPCWIWRASAEDPASETTTSWPVAASNPVSISASALLRLAAAKTVIVSAVARFGTVTAPDAAAISADDATDKRNQGWSAHLAALCVGLEGVIFDQTYRKGFGMRSSAIVLRSHP
jgi:hypothetical protein